MLPMVLWKKPVKTTAKDIEWEKFLREQNWGDFEAEEAEEIDSDGVDELPTGLAPPEHDQDLDDYRFLGVHPTGRNGNKHCGWCIDTPEMVRGVVILCVG
eukprot:Platyproteum_vivax@DN14243_c0_g1_i1.p3